MALVNWTWVKHNVKSSVSLILTIKVLNGNMNWKILEINKKHSYFFPSTLYFCLPKSIIQLPNTIIKSSNELSSTDCLSLNLDDPVNVYLHKDVSKTTKVTERLFVVFYTQSVLLAATSNALWHFPSKIETILAKTTRLKSALRFSLDVSRPHPINVFLVLLSPFFFLQGQISSGTFWKPISWKRKRTFLMANASNSLHDAYESAYYIWRKTFFAAQSSDDILHSQNNAVLLFDRHPDSRWMEAVCFMNLAQNAYVSCHNANVSLM